MNDDIIKVMDLGLMSEQEKQQFNSDINNKKMASAFTKKARELVKAPTCLYCDREVTSFCNSHSVPEFCLRNITADGKVSTLNSLIELPIIKQETGVGESGTFQIICRDCDSKIFADYENPDNYSNVPSQKMLAQIALKNNLKYISKRKQEIGLHKIMEAELDIPSNTFKYDDYVKILDLREYLKGFHKAKKHIAKNDTGYYLCYYKKLNYVVPLAFQSSIAMIFDFEGSIINDIYNPSSEYEIKNINVCVFPLQSESVVMLFIEDGDKRYRKFYKQLNKLDLNNQLAAITFLIFAYSEEVYYSKTIKQELISHQEMLQVAQSGQNIISTTLDFNPYEQIKSRYDLAKRGDIPNLLSEKYKLR